jgi:hypothetical protein
MACRQKRTNRRNNPALRLNFHARIRHERLEYGLDLDTLRGIDHRSGADIPATKVKVPLFRGGVRFLAKTEEAREATMTVYGQRSPIAAIVTNVFALLSGGAAVQQYKKTRRTQ